MKPGELNLSELKEGMVGINYKSNPFDLMGTVTRVLQGGSRATHTWVCLKRPNGELFIATTGAKFGIFYGEVDPKTYLKDKEYVLVQTVDPMTTEMLKSMYDAHEKIMASGIKRLYGSWKFAYIYGLALQSGMVTKTGPSVASTDSHTIQFPICSQAVAYCLYSAGIPVGKGLGIEDYTAVFPSVILEEATRTSEYIDSGVILPRPSYRLKLVSDKTFFSIK